MIQGASLTMIKRIILIAAAVLLAVLLVACGDKSENNTEKENGAADTEGN